MTEKLSFTSMDFFRFVYLTDVIPWYMSVQLINSYNGIDDTASLSTAGLST